MFPQVRRGLTEKSGRLSTAKLLPRPVVGTRVQRNRAKRLLRETFRSNEPSLRTLTKNYDWVLNAKSAVLSQKMDAPRQEFEGIIEKVGRLEQRESVR